MSVENLVQENNRKRKLLNEENEQYYSDLLVYIRLQWRLSEQQSEEILMEMLDHLLDGQREGKSAEDIFGEDPLVFADELIKEITHERPRNIVLFLAGIGVNLLGWVLVIRSLIVFVLSSFTEVNTKLNIFHVSIVAIAISLFVFLNVSFILKTIKEDLFHNRKRANFKQMNKVGLVSGGSMAVVLVIVKFTPSIGPSFPFDPLLSLAIGLLILLFYYSLKKIYKIKLAKSFDS